MKNSIDFEGRSYPVVNLEDKGLVSVEELEYALFTYDGDYVSDEAKAIDEQIVFFVPTDIIYKGAKVVAQYVENNM